MADQKRKLIIEVLGNAKDAASALGDVRSDTDRAAEKFVKFGQVTVAASAAGAIGLYKLASAAGDYAETQSAAEVIFGDAVDTVVKYGEEATKTAGLSKKAAVEGANTFGTFGKSAGLAGEDLAGFSTEMVQLAGDLASFKNTSPEQAIEAIGAALRGESEPIRQYGVLLDDATLKQRAMTIGIYEGTGALTPQQKVLAAHAEILAQTGDAQGDYLRTSDSLANQQRTLTAEFENLKVGIGSGVLPVVTQLVGGAGDLVGKFGELDPGTQTLVGKLGAVVVVGGLVVGSLSMIAGKALEARDRFTTLGEDGTRSLNNVGKAAAAMSGALTAIALTELIGGVSNELGGYAQSAEDALNRTRDALLNEDDAAAIDQFGQSVAETQKEWLGFGETFSSVGRELRVANTGIQADIENVDLAFKRLLEDSPEAAAGLADALERQLAVLDPASREYQDTADMVDRFRDRLDASALAADVVTREQSDAAAAVGALGDASGETKVDVQEMTDSLVELDGQLAKMLNYTLDADQAQRALLDATDGLTKSISENGRTLDINTAAGRKNRDALDDQVAASFDLAQKQAMIDTTGQASRATLQAQAETLAQLRREGVIPTDEAYLQLLATYNLTPEAIETTITADTGQAKREAYELSVQLAQTPGVSEPLRSQIQTLIDQGRLQEARALLADLTRPRAVPITIYGQAGNAAGNALINGIGRLIPARARGGPIDPGAPYLVGEEGPEIIIPKDAGTVLPNDVYNAVASRRGTPLGAASSPVSLVIQVDLRGQVITQDTATYLADQLERAVANGVQLPLLREAMAGAA